MKSFQRFIRFNNIVQNSKLSALQLLKYFLYFTNPKIRKMKIKKKFSFVKEDFLNQINTEILQKLSQSFHNLDRLQKEEIQVFQLPHLLKYEDKNSMAHSIESRLPFLDYRLVEFSLSLPPDYKVYKGWSKYILRKSMENLLGKEIIWRKNKFGFEAPTKTWLSEKKEINNKISNSIILQKILKSPPKSFDDLSVIWRLYNIALWEKQFNIVWND
jgi:asparagine synthase (glutamine-hydrolysing)